MTTGCGSGSGTGSAATTAPGTTISAPASTRSTQPTTPGATFSGDYTGTIAANLCTGGVMSITVTVQSDANPYRGSLSSTSAGFVGPDAADFTVPSGGTKPTVSGSTYTVDGVVLEDVVVSKKKVTLAGSLTCP